jgi:hypothetical protein
MQAEREIQKSHNVMPHLSSCHKIVIMLHEIASYGQTTRRHVSEGGHLNDKNLRCYKVDQSVRVTAHNSNHTPTIYKFQT